MTNIVLREYIIKTQDTCFKGMCLVFFQTKEKNLFFLFSFLFPALDHLGTGNISLFVDEI